MIGTKQTPKNMNLPPKINIKLELEINKKGSLGDPTILLIWLIYYKLFHYLRLEI